MKETIANLILADSTQQISDRVTFLLTEQNRKYFDFKTPYLSVSELLDKYPITTKIVGITGTNGKTTTAFMISFLLQKLGYRVGVQGTEGFFINDARIDKKTLTTPPILKTLSHLYHSKLDFLIMEVSSHAIVQKRIEGLIFSLKVFTNLSQDHLDFHKSMQEYANVKSSFLLDNTPKVINYDQTMIDYNPNEAVTYGKKDFSLLKRLSVEGEFNKYNTLAALFSVKVLTGKLLTDEIALFKGVAGRMETISKVPHIIVDFAHTPDGMKNVLSSLPQKEISVVLGAGGDRDRLKRALMGEVASHYATQIILTNDNPRSEDPKQILDDIAKGINDRKYTVIEDRKEAICYAIKTLQTEQVLLVLGKGDERVIEIKGEKIPHSDKEEILKCLNS